MRWGLRRCVVQIADATRSRMRSSERMPPMQQRKHPRLKREATVAYRTMNKKKSVDICRVEGLSTLGNEAELRQRHSDYIMLYTFECDSEYPRSVGALLNEIRSKEISIKVRVSFCFASLLFCSSEKSTPIIQLSLFFFTLILRFAKEGGGTSRPEA
jgi:hypothetical protein